MHGPMRSRVGNIQEERIIPFVFIDEPGGMIVDCIGIVKLLGLVFRIGVGRNQGVLTGQGIRVEETARPVNGSVEPVESTLSGPIVLRIPGVNLRGDVPFARKVSRILGRFENFGNRAHVASQVPLVAGKPTVAHHPSDARLVGVGPR